MQMNSIDVSFFIPAAAWTGEEEQLCFHVEIVSQKTVRYNCVSCEETKDIVNMITFPLEHFSTTSLTRFGSYCICFPHMYYEVSHFPTGVSLIQ